MEEDLSEYVNDITDYLSEFTLKERLSILANIFIKYGMALMTEENRQFSAEEAFMYIMNDIETNGNSLGNSLAMQGITILHWLSKEKEMID
jgi:hypothetical protein